MTFKFFLLIFYIFFKIRISLNFFKLFISYCLNQSFNLFNSKIINIFETFYYIIINCIIIIQTFIFISWLFILFSKLSLIRILFSKLSLIRILLSLFSLISLLFRPAFSSFFLLYLLSLFSLSMIFLFFYIINEEFSSQGYYFYYLIRN